MEMEKLMRALIKRVFISRMAKSGERNAEAICKLFAKDVLLRGVGIGKREISSQRKMF